MLYCIAIVSGISLGLLAKGEMKHIMNVKLRHLWSILLAVIIDVAVQVLAANGVLWIHRYLMLFHGLKYLLLLFGFYANRHYLGIVVAGIGCLLNSVVVMFNGGKMPVDEALIRHVFSERIPIERLMNDGKHTLADANTKLAFLADTIHPPSFLGIGAQILSIGDAVLLFGLFLTCFEIVNGRKILNRFNVQHGG